jgi:BNR/Asp-box repeat
MRSRHLHLAVYTAVAALVSASMAAAAPASQAYTWATVPWGGGGYVDGFVYHPKVKNLLYARTDVGGAYRYDYAGKRWIPLQDSLAHEDGDFTGIFSLAVDPNDANKLYVACGLYLGQWAHDGAVMRSDDQGATWKKTELKIKLGGNSDGRGAGERLQVDPNSGNILFLGSNQDGLWKSTDGAKSFAKVSFPNANVSLVLFDPNSGGKGAASQIIYVGSNADKGGLWVSHDGGSSFALVPGAPLQSPQRAVISADGYLYVAFSAGDGKNKNEINPSNAATGGVWKMELKTGQWTEITPVKTSGWQGGWSGVDVDPAHPGTIVASTLDHWWPEPDDIFITKDGGAHWSSLRKQSHGATRFPWREGEWMGSWISDVKINPYNSDELIYGTGGGLWMSRNLTAADSGKTVEFDFADDNLEETATIDLVSPPAGATLVVAFGDVGGAAWDDITKSPPASAVFKGGTHRSVGVAWLKPNLMARSLDAKPYGYYSEDGAQTWTTFPTTPPYSPQDAQGNWRTQGAIAVAAGGSSMVWNIPRDTAYYSFDKGKTWTPSQGWPKDVDGRLNPVADKAVNGVFYVLDRAGGKILISVDGGKSFKPTITGLPTLNGWEGAQLAAAPGAARDLWLAGPFGLLHSPDPGSPMVSVKDINEAWQIGFGKAAPGQTRATVFMAGKIKGQEGIWRSDDQGKSWVRINDDVHRFSDGGGLTGDPTEYGTVYMGRAAGGLIVGKIKP